MNTSCERSSVLTDHFLAAAPGLFREPSGLLRHPFIVPGAAYAQELWDWDSYWTTRGLLELAETTENAELRERALRYGRGSLLNFVEHQDASGGMPIMMRADNPDVFGCFNAEGIERNQAKPVFGQFALMLADAEAEAGQGGGEGDAELAEQVLPALSRFYSYWDKKYKHAGTGLLVWGSDVGIGVDNDPTTYARPFRSSANLLLNCLYHQDLTAASALASRFGDDALADRWRARAEEIAEAIRTRCWDERDQFFYSLDVQCADHRATLIPWAKPGLPLAWSALPIRIRMFTGFLPLWCGIASDRQAAALRKQALDPATFRAPAGIRSLALNEPMFNLAASGNPSNWLGPTWIMSNYLVWQALRRGNFAAEADALAEKTRALLEADIAAHGATHEFYHPDTCAPIMNRGFISWNLLAVEMKAAGSLR